MSESRTPIRHSRLRALFEAMKRRDQLDDMDWDLMSEVERDNFAAAIDEVFPLPSETRCGLPRQPTDEMCMAGVLEANKGTQAEGYANGIGRMSAIWAAMYDAYKPSCNGRHVWPDQPERTMASLCEKCGMTFARHVAVECP